MNANTVDLEKFDPNAFFFYRRREFTQIADFPAWLIRIRVEIIDRQHAADVGGFGLRQLFDVVRVVTHA